MFNIVPVVEFKLAICDPPWNLGDFHDETLTTHNIMHSCHATHYIIYMCVI